MSEYSRKVAAGAIAAVLIAVSLGYVATTFPSGVPSSMTTGQSSSTTLATSRLTTSSVSTSTGTVTSGTESASTVSGSSVASSSGTGMTTSGTTETSTILSSSASGPVLVVTSASLTVNSSGGYLSVGLYNSGDRPLQDPTISLSSVSLAIIPELGPQGHTWIEVQVPGALTLTPGQTYELTVTLGSVPQASMNVTAASG